MKPNLITEERASEIIELSKAECSLTGDRLGSIIQKHLTLKNLSNVIGDSSKEFFYVKDDEDAIRLFMKYCVQQEEIIV